MKTNFTKKEKEEEEEIYLSRSSTKPRCPLSRPAASLQTGLHWSNKQHAPLRASKTWRRTRAPLPQTPSYNLKPALQTRKRVVVTRANLSRLSPLSHSVVSLPPLSTVWSVTCSGAEAARIVTNREQPPPGAFSCECMHTQARYSRRCGRVCACVCGCL